MKKKRALHNGSIVVSPRGHEFAVVRYRRRKRVDPKDFVETFKLRSVKWGVILDSKYTLEQLLDLKYTIKPEGEAQNASA